MPSLNHKIRRQLLRGEVRYSRGKIKLKKRLGVLKPISIESYLGYCQEDWCWLRGRVLEDRGIKPLTAESGSWRNLRNMMKRYLSDELPVVPVNLELGNKNYSTTTDEEGYFEFLLTDLPRGLLTAPRSRAVLSLPGLGMHQLKKSHFNAEMVMINQNTEYGVISDIDDTILETGATGLIKHLRTVLLNNAQTRVPFAGVSDFYHALQQGASGKANNPIFYVSSSPWNIYDLLHEFMEFHDIPTGPVMLKDFGLHEDHYFKSSHRQHKYTLIENFLKSFPELPFFLIGDTGQQDAMIYSEVVSNYSGRIHAVYLREINHGNIAHDEKLAEAKANIESFGIPVLFMPATDVAARHAEQNGWISQRARQITETGALADIADT
jgi:phosphatidate phosphatase APP1